MIVSSTAGMVPGCTYDGLLRLGVRPGVLFAGGIVPDVGAGYPSKLTNARGLVVFLFSVDAL